MEEKNVGKFLNYVKKFLTMSFLSALATVTFSCFSITKAEVSSDLDSDSYSDSVQNDEEDEIDQKDTAVTNKTIKFRKGDSWLDIFNRAKVSTHDAAGNTLPGCTGHWMITDLNRNVVLYNERGNYSGMTPYDYCRKYGGTILFSYQHGNDDLYSNKTIKVRLKNETRNYLIPSEYEYAYTVSGNEKVAKDIDPNNLVATLGITAFDEFNQPVSGVWSWENPEASINSYLSAQNLVFRTADQDYNDLKVTINILNPGKEETRTAVQENDVTQNVASDGTTSTIKKSSGITWVREESNGSYAWYGFEDPNNVLPEGTRLSVKWDPLDRDFAYDIYSLFSVGGILPEKVWRFNLQALSPKNELIHYFRKPLNIYIEVGEDWDKDEIVGLYVKLENKIKENWDIRYEDIVIDGEKRTFAVLSPNHFSEYYLADNTTGKDIYDKFLNDYTEKLTKWLEENPKATVTEIKAQQDKIMEELMRNLPDEERKVLIDYIDSLNSKKSSNITEQSSPKSETVTESKSATSTPSSSSSSSSSKSSASTKTGADDYSRLLSFLSLGSLAGIGSCLKKKKD